MVIGIERLMFEASGFDFTARYPHKYVIKVAKAIGIEKDVSKVAWDMLTDLYKTFAPLKQTSFTMAIACIRLTTLILERQQDIKIDLNEYFTTEEEVMETILDLLDLYTHFQKSSIVGSQHVIEKFIQLRIKLNQEMSDAGIPRYTNLLEPAKNGIKSNVKTPKTPITPASPAETRINGRDVNSPATLSPRSSGSGRRGMGARGQDGTVRFMQDAAKAKQEKEIVSEYFKEEFEEYEVEVEELIKKDRGPPNHHQGGYHHHRNDRFHNKRSRR
jgi:CTD kinase subunit beta